MNARLAGTLALGSCFLGCGKSTAEVQPPLPALAIQEELRIDGHAAVLEPILHFVVGPHGEMVFSQGQPGVRLAVFDAEGAPIGTIGRQGSGPGEFQAIAALGLRGDSVWVFDLRQIRVTIVGPDLTTIRTYQASRTPVRLTVGDSSYFYPSNTTRGLTPEGLHIKLLTVPLDPPAPAWVPASALAVVAPDGSATLLDSIPSVAFEIRSNGASVGTPYRNRPAYTLSPDGSRVAIAWAPPVGQAPTHIGVSVTASDGSRVFSRTYPINAEPLPQAAWDSVVTAIEARNSERPLAPGLLEVLHATTPPAAYPPVQGIVIGNDDRVWVRLRDAEGFHYLALGPEGEPLGRVTLPENSEIVGAEGELIYVIEEDEFGVDSIVRYRVSF